MRPSQTYWGKHLLQAAIEEVKDEYKEKGYTVKSEAKLGALRLDLMASKGGHEIIFEFRAKSLVRRSKKQMLQLQKMVQRRPHAELRLVYVSPPESIEVEVDAIESKIESELMDELPSDLDLLSTHTVIEGVADVELTKVHLSTGVVSLEGHCNIEVRLQYGSSSDEGYEVNDSFPAEFELEMNGDLDVQHSEFKVDTSSFYGRSEGNGK